MPGTPILIVDDDPQLLRLLGLRLSKEGYDVIAAASAEEALRKLEAIRPQLVISDMRMTGMDGLALFDRVQRRYPQLPVIILTAHGTIPDAIEATRRGLFGYLTKPFEAKDLLREVARALAQAPPPAAASQAWRKAIVTRNPELEALLADARLVAAGDASVLITGASGTGKELLARAIHDASPRHGADFLGINCGAIPEALLESELFGHVKGAFTGAARDHPGLLQAANGGTLFLDEIGDMPLALQVKLLRVLQERQVRPIGSTRSNAIDIRVLSATHRDLEAEIAAGRFREDLYYRLNVVTLTLPPLDRRREDIPLLATHFLEQIAARYGKEIAGFAPDALATLAAANWPGNIRQLLNVVEKTVALSTTALIPKALVQRAISRQSDEMDSLDEAKRKFEYDYLVQLLKLSAGNVTQAARLAQRNRSEFYSLLHRHALDPTNFKAKP